MGGRRARSVTARSRARLAFKRTAPAWGGWRRPARYECQNDRWPGRVIGRTAHFARSGDRAARQTAAGGLQHALGEGLGGVRGVRLHEGEGRHHDAAHTDAGQLLRRADRVVPEHPRGTGRELDGGGVAAVVGGRLADDVDQLGQLGRGALPGEEAVAEPAGALRGGPRVPADHDRDRPLGGLGVRRHPVERRELAVELGGVAGPEGPHGADVLVGAGTPAGPGHAEGHELLLQPAHADPELDATSGQVVERGQLLGQHHRVALREDEDAGGEAQRRRGGGDVGQPHQRVRDGRRRHRRHLPVGAVRVGETRSRRGRRRARRSRPTRSRRPRRSWRPRGHPGRSTSPSCWRT